MLSLASLRTLQKGRETNTALSHNFGTLTIQAGKCGILHNQVTLGYNVDRSGSMSTRAKDGRTKLEHATYTLEQMVHYLQEDRSMAACTARVGVNAFDHQNTPLAVAQRLGLHRCKDNMWASLGEEEERKKLLSSLGALRTRGSTDIGGACALIKEEFGSLGPAQPAEHRAHILLTVRTFSSLTDCLTKDPRPRRASSRAARQGATITLLGMAPTTTVCCSKG